MTLHYAIARGESLSRAACGLLFRNDSWRLASCVELVRDLDTACPRCIEYLHPDTPLEEPCYDYSEI